MALLATKTRFALGYSRRFVVGADAEIVGLWPMGVFALVRGDSPGLVSKLVSSSGALLAHLLGVAAPPKHHGAFDHASPAMVCSAEDERGGSARDDTSLAWALTVCPPSLGPLDTEMAALTLTACHLTDHAARQLAGAQSSITRTTRTREPLGRVYARWRTRRMLIPPFA